LTESARAAFAGSKFDWSRTAVTASTPLMVSEDEREAVAAVVGLQMTYARFHEHFVNATRLCPRDFAASADTAAAASCNLTCASPVTASRSLHCFETLPPAEESGSDLSVWRPWAGSLLEAPTHPQML